MIKLKVLVNTVIRTGLTMKDLGNKTNKMAMVLNLGQTERHIRVNTKTERRRAQEILPGLMGLFS